ncbi:hypothetical protein [Cellulomonas sp. URHD0024]|uniref:hypothetical protein n=1 Tax=Cellulomonas sp. URHD0024 TaxID=1302620 RepID=UPI000402E69B|nr:hypothetical protein [Cellulomonas sp. URHD0024]
MSALPPDVVPGSMLARYWDAPVSRLVEPPTHQISVDEAERLTIASLVVMALIDGYWNGNKSGALGRYPWRENQRVEDGRYAGDALGDRYLGHNIACIAVDENGSILDFEFNHNEIFNSSAEHAEARLIRRLFLLNQSYNDWQRFDAEQAEFVKYGNTMNGVTIYTSLESCAQCSGMMTLAACGRVVYLQTDPGQYRVGNILYNLSKPPPASTTHPTVVARPHPAPKYWAPEPMAAAAFGFGPMEELDRAYLAFVAGVQSDPTSRYFFESPGGKRDQSSSITSFLCTDAARAVYSRAASALASLSLAQPDYRPPRSDGQREGVRSNGEMLDHARRFVRHALVEARRGTPHH